MDGSEATSGNHTDAVISPWVLAVLCTIASAVALLMVLR